MYVVECGTLDEFGSEVPTLRLKAKDERIANNTANNLRDAMQEVGITLATSSYNANNGTCFLISKSGQPSYYLSLLLAEE